MSMKGNVIRISVFATALSALASVACKSKPEAVSRDVPPAIDAAPADGGAIVATATDASPEAKKGEPSPFVPIARTNGTLEIQRIENAPLIASARGSQGYAYVLASDGTLGVFDPIATHHAETHEGMGWDIGRIAGVWPNAVYVEMAIAGGRSETVIESYLVDVDKGTVTRKRFNEHLAFAHTWKDGRLLGWTAESSSVMGPFLSRAGRFEILSGTRPPAMPVLPKKAGSSTGEFVAYESGRIFALAGLEKGEAEWDRSYIWDFADGVHAKPVKLRGDVVALERGRNEQEALVLGMVGTEHTPFLARFDGKEWVDVKLPFTSTPTSLSIGGDGTVWIAASQLWKAEFPELRFTRVPIDSAYAVTSVVARVASDVWLVASGASDTERNVLLHSQTSTPPMHDFGGDGDPQRAVLSKKDPPPYYAGCAVPFILLGREDEMTEKDVRAIAASMVDWPHMDDGVLVQVKSGKVYGFELSTSVDSKTPARYRTPAATLATVKAKHPAAKLVCTRATIVRTVEKEKQ